MKTSIKLLILLGAMLLAATDPDRITAFAETPAERLSRLLMGGKHPVTNAYLPDGEHAGVDFGSVKDGVTIVSSPTAGTIIANTSACGKVAIFDGTNTIILAHLTSRTVLAVGKRLSVGDYVGKTSKIVGGGCKATAAHLHIEVRPGKNATMALPSRDNTKTTRNPIAYLIGSIPHVEPTPSPTPRPSPAPAPPITELYDLNGEWTAIGYPHGTESIKVRIRHVGGKVEAIKVTSNSEVPAGAVTWYGEYTSNRFVGKIQIADTNFSNRRWAGVVIRMVDRNSFALTQVEGDPVTGKFFGPLRFERVSIKSR